jgi:hypothetical protein
MIFLQVKVAEHLTHDRTKDALQYVCNDVSTRDLENGRIAVYNTNVDILHQGSTNPRHEVTMATRNFVVE